LRLNVWYSAKGVQEGNFVFPYDARSVVDGKTRTFRTISDVYNELERAYDGALSEDYNVGEALYMEHFFFANSSDLLNQESQNFIKEYQFCKDSNTPPYPSLQSTPANFIDKWEIVRDEIAHIIRQEKNANK
jgi:hypothetical protein